MYRARIRDSERPVFAAQIDGEPLWYTQKHPLICWMCDAGVHGKGTYAKRNGASYRSHFALNPGTRHAGACPFNPVAVITSIARGAQDIAHVDDGVLRLTLPGDLEDLAPAPGTVKPEWPPREVTARQIDTVPPPLPPLLNCAAKIARFLQLNAFDDKVVAHFKVQPYGRKSTIAWGRFCYGPTAASYGELVKRLDPDRPERPPTHPIAVYGTVQRVGRDRSGRSFVFLADHGDLDGEEFEVVVRSMHPTLIKPLTVGTHVLAVGKWKVFPGGRVPQLVLFAEEPWQIAYWHTDADTGASTQPTSPPTLPRATRRPTRPARPSSRTATSASRRPATAPQSRTGLPPAAPTRPAPTPPAVATHDASRSMPQAPAPTTPPGPPRTPSPTPSPVEPTAADSASSGAPSVPPPPPHPPRPADMPPVSPRRRRGTGLAGWLGRRKKRRG